MHGTRSPHVANRKGIMDRQPHNGAANFSSLEWHSYKLSTKKFGLYMARTISIFFFHNGLSISVLFRLKGKADLASVLRKKYPDLTVYSPD